MKKSKILVWDIENSHIILRAWSLFQQFNTPDNIIQDWYIICAAYKWLGEPRTKIKAVSLLNDPARFREDHTDDYHVVSHMHGVLSQAEGVIAHNGDAFDLKKFNARAIFHGLHPIPELVQIDTLKMAKQKLRLTSNKLDYLGQFLGLGNKIHTGNELWIRCEEGERKAIREMVVYNKRDVDLLEKVYNKLAPYSQPKFNRNIVGEDGSCPTCGEVSLQSRGVYQTKTRLYQRYQCTSCGSWSRAVATIKDVKATIK